jgi:hypothetical protein
LRRKQQIVNASSIEDNVTTKAILHDDILDLDSIIGDILQNTIANNITDHNEDETVETVIADLMKELVRYYGRPAIFFG